MTLKIWFILLPFNTICPVVQHAYLKISKAFPFRKEKKKEAVLELSRFRDGILILWKMPCNTGLRELSEWRGEKSNWSVKFVFAVIDMMLSLFVFKYQNGFLVELLQLKTCNTFNKNAVFTLVQNWFVWI